MVGIVEGRVGSGEIDGIEQVAGVEIGEGVELEWEQPDFGIIAYSVECRK